MKSNLRQNQSVIIQFNNRVKKIYGNLLSHQFLILAWITAGVIILFDHIPASAAGAAGAGASSGSGFGDAIDQIKGNSVIAGAGTEAVDLFSFPFLIAGFFILLIILFAVVYGSGQMVNGRDWITPLLALVGVFAIILLGSGIYQFIANSGLFG